MNKTDFCQLSNGARCWGWGRFFSILLILVPETNNEAFGCLLWERLMFPILHSTLVSKQIGNSAKVNRHVGNLA